MLLDRAIAIDPYFALVKALRARCYAWRNPQGWATAPEEEKRDRDPARPRGAAGWRRRSIRAVDGGLRNVAAGCRS